MGNGSSRVTPYKIAHIYSYSLILYMYTYACLWVRSFSLLFHTKFHYSLRNWRKVINWLFRDILKQRRAVEVKNRWKIFSVLIKNEAQWNILSEATRQILIMKVCSSHDCIVYIYIIQRIWMNNNELNLRIAKTTEISNLQFTRNYVRSSHVFYVWVIFFRHPFNLFRYRCQKCIIRGRKRLKVCR